MNCPYFEEGYIGICGVSESRYVPSIERMENYCFRKAYRLCPTLFEFLSENNFAMANFVPEQKLAHQ